MEGKINVGLTIRENACLANIQLKTLIKYF